MIRHPPGDLGSAVYKAFAGKSPNTEPTSFADALGWFVKAAGGNISAAARLAGVPRRSMRDWLSGTSTPKDERRRQVAESARLSERRSRLPAGRESRLRGRDVSGALLYGAYNYDADDAGQVEPRVVEIGRYLRDGTIDVLLDAYLAGAQPDELRSLFASQIDDPADFYNTTMANPPTDAHGWTVNRITF